MLKEMIVTGKFAFILMTLNNSPKLSLIIRFDCSVNSKNFHGFCKTPIHDLLKSFNQKHYICFSISLTIKKIKFKKKITIFKKVIIIRNNISLNKSCRPLNFKGIS